MRALAACLACLVACSVAPRPDAEETSTDLVVRILDTCGLAPSEPEWHVTLTDAGVCYTVADFNARGVWIERTKDWARCVESALID